MPRLIRRDRASLDARTLSAILYGRPLGGVDHRRRGLFWGGFYTLRELDMLRELWNRHRESFIDEFQQQHPGLLPWAHWRFSAKGQRDEGPYYAEYQRLAAKTNSPASTPPAV